MIRIVFDWTMLSSVRALSRRVSQDPFRQPAAAAFPVRGEGFLVRGAWSVLRAGWGACLPRVGKVPSLRGGRGP